MLTSSIRYSLRDRARRAAAAASSAREDAELDQLLRRVARHQARLRVERVPARRVAVDRAAQPLRRGPVKYSSRGSPRSPSRRSSSAQPIGAPRAAAMLPVSHPRLRTQERSPRARDGRRRRGGQEARSKRRRAEGDDDEHHRQQTRSRRSPSRPATARRCGSSARLATVKATGETTGGRVAVIEHLAPRGAGSPLHVHRREDEWFYVLEGELTFWVGGQVIVAPAGVVRLRPARRAAHVHRQLRAGALPARRRARRLRGLRARRSRSRRRAASSRRRRPSRPTSRA